MDVENTSNVCDAVVFPRNQPSAQFMGQGQETVSVVLSLLLLDPEVILLIDPHKFLTCYSLSKPKLSVPGPRLTFRINKQEKEKQTVFPVELSLLHCKVSSPGFEV